MLKLYISLCCNLALTVFLGSDETYLVKFRERLSSVFKHLFCRHKHRRRCPDFKNIQWFKRCSLWLGSRLSRYNMRNLNMVHMTWLIEDISVVLLCESQLCRMLNEVNLLRCVFWSDCWMEGSFLKVSVQYAEKKIHWKVNFVHPRTSRQNDFNRQRSRWSL